MRFIGYCCLCWLAFACTEDGKGDGSNAVLLSPAQSTYTAACQRDTLQFEAEGAWSVVADSPWVTLELAEGKGDGAVPLYIQQNDGEQAREALDLDPKTPMVHIHLALAYAANGDSKHCEEHLRQISVRDLAQYVHKTGKTAFGLGNNPEEHIPPENLAQAFLRNKDNSN